MLLPERESLESVEGAIEFDEDIRCALERAFEMNPEVAKELEQVVGETEVSFFKKMVTDTDSKKIIQSDQMRTVYGQMAKRELERIEAEDEDDQDLTCGHSIDDHVDTLRFLLDKIEPSVN